MGIQQEFYPITQPQQRIWNTQMMYPSSPMFQIGGTVLIRGALDYSCLQEAITTFVESHDAFQIRFTMNDGVIKQYFCKNELVNVEFLDFSGYQDAYTKYKQWEKHQKKALFMVYDTPLYQFNVFNLGENLGGYFIKLYHAIADGWSVQILTQEISEIYEQLKSGIKPISNNSSSYCSYIESEKKYLNSKRYQRDKLFWEEQLKSTSFCKKKRKQYLDGTRLEFPISIERTQAVREFCNINKFTIVGFFLFLYALYRFKLTNEKDIVVGMPVLGRSGRLERQTVGMFVNVIPLHITIDEQVSAFEMHTDVEKVLRGTFRHQKYPYNHIEKDIGIQDGTLYDTCINYYNSEMRKMISGCPVVNTEFYNGQQEYVLQIIVRDWNDSGQLQLDFDFRNDNYAAEEIEAMYLRLCHLMDWYIADQQTLISQIEITPRQEKELLLEEFNKTKCGLTCGRTVVDLFRDQVEKTPENIAIEDGGQFLTYRELSRKALSVSVALQNLKLPKGSIIGILASNSVELLVGLIGTLQCGYAFLPIDESTNSERIRFMLEDAGVQVVLTNIEFPLDLEWNGSIITLHSIQDCSTHDEIALPNEDMPAYVIYTSGSSGRPKGVIISHSNLANYISWAKEVYTEGDSDAFALYSSISFDLTITTLFTPLVCGGRIIVYSQNSDEYPLHAVLRENRCTVLKMTPSHLSLVADLFSTNTTIKSLIIGGEDLKRNLASKIHLATGNKVRIFNEYGPTEATVGCMIYQFDYDKHNMDSVPIGRPVANVKIYILNQHRQCVPVGVRGELYIAGKGVSGGYLNRRDLTEKCFVYDDRFDEWLYKTGDMAVFIDYNTILYCGRNDSQVKIRGYRIELSEIENVLLMHPSVINVVVLTQETVADTTVICAYIVGVEAAKDDIIRHTQKYLPSYMIPTQLNFLMALPLTRNGKIDEDELLKIEIQTCTVDTDKYEDNLLCRILTELLNVNGILLQDNFYNLGGDSIKAIQLSTKMREFGYVLKIKDILDNPTIIDMQNYISQPSQREIVQKDCIGLVVHTPIICWFFAKPLYCRESFCQGIQLMLKRNIPVSFLEEALWLVIQHHDMLRINVDKKNTLYFNNAYLVEKVHIREVDIINMSTEILEEKIQLESHCLSREMEFENRLLIRSSLLHSNSGDIWLIKIHHLIIDGVSWRILLDDLDNVLDQLLSGQVAALPEKTKSFQEFAQKFSELSSDNCRQLIVNTIEQPVEYTGTATELSLIDTKNLLGEANNSYNSKPAELLLAAVLCALMLHTDPKSFLLIIELHGREAAARVEMDVSRTVGWFTQRIAINAPSITEDLENAIITVKETYRKAIKSGEVFPEAEHNGTVPMLCFNYMGDFKKGYDWFCAEVEMSHNNEMTADIEVDAIVIEQQLRLSIRTANAVIGNHDIFNSDCIKAINMILQHCMVRDDIYFTPQDFDAVQLSQEDLNTILGEF